jgi:hypothetical protein
MAIEDISIECKMTLSQNGDLILNRRTGNLRIPSDKNHDCATFYAEQQKSPMPVFELAEFGYWAFRGYYLLCDMNAAPFLGRERLTMLIKHRVMQEEQRWEKIAREVEAFDNLDRIQEARQRSAIPRSVRMFVWQRDEGKCVECGSQDNLEYDHLIPVVKGGSSTERNLRLLCEACKRRKGAAI